MDNTDKTKTKPAWTPSADVQAAIDAIVAIDDFDKKGIAAVVAAAITKRTSAKATRELAVVAEEPSDA